MAKKINTSGIIFSTDPSFSYEQNTEENVTLPPAEQALRIKMETKHRAGKAVTLITGFIGKQNDVELLGKKIKTACGTGGSVKDFEMIIQGDHRDKVLQWLLKNGYSKSKKI